MIRDEHELQTVLGQMVAANHAIKAAELERDKLKQDADVACEQACSQSKAEIARLENELLAYYNKHLDDFFPPKKKTAIIGPAKVFLRLDPPVVLIKGSEQEAEPGSIIDAIEARIPESRGTLRAQLQACLETKTKLVMSAVKKLDAATLQDMNLELVQIESLKWKPCDER